MDPAQCAISKPVAMLSPASPADGAEMAVKHSEGRTSSCVGAEALEAKDGALRHRALAEAVKMVAKQHGLSAEAVHADMKANILPGVTLVPAMVIAIEQAQKIGSIFGHGAGAPSMGVWL